jgi:hypothetical protein
MLRVTIPCATPAQIRRHPHGSRKDLAREPRQRGSRNEVGLIFEQLVSRQGG